MQRYVSVLAVSLDGQDMVMLRKDRGPPQIVGKLTVPGGKVDAEDTSLAHAAARELKEECGLDVEPASLLRIFHKGDGIRFDWTTFFARTDISGACTQPGETEPIHIAAVSDVLEALDAGGHDHAPDLGELMAAAAPALAAAAIPCEPPRGASKKIARP